MPTGADVLRSSHITLQWSLLSRPVLLPVTLADLHSRAFLLRLRGPTCRLEAPGRQHSWEQPSPRSDGTFWLMTLTGITWRMYYHRLPEVLMCSQWLPECPGPSQWFASSFLLWFPASLPGLPGSTSPQNCLPLTAPLFQGDPSLRYKVNYYWLREYYK